jgi:hypothetical protein
MLLVRYSGKRNEFHAREKTPEAGDVGEVFSIFFNRKPWGSQESQIVANVDTLFDRGELEDASIIFSPCYDCCSVTIAAESWQVSRGVM